MQPGGDSWVDGASGPRSGAHVLGGIRSLVRSVDNFRHAVADRLGLGAPELVTIVHLHFEGPQRASQIAARTGLTQGSVTALIDRLERRGYVTRIRPQENRRIVRVELTDEGAKVGQQIFEPVLPLLDIAAQEPGTPDPMQLAHCLERIADLFHGLASSVADEARP